MISMHVLMEFNGVSQMDLQYNYYYYHKKILLVVVIKIIIIVSLTLSLSLSLYHIGLLIVNRTNRVSSNTKTSCKIIQDSYMNLASRHLHSVSAYHLASFLQDCCKIIMILVS